MMVFAERGRLGLRLGLGAFTAEGGRSEGRSEGRSGGRSEGKGGLTLGDAGRSLQTAGP